MNYPKRMPTRPGDALILESTTSVHVHAVGQVTEDGQEDFYAKANVRYLRDHATAAKTARAVAKVGRRIFVRNIDVRGCAWSEISH